MNRRHFIHTAFLASIAASVHAAEKRAPRSLLRSSWQVVNIGDIAHTPGVMALIEKHISGAEVRLLASNDLSDEVMAMDHRRFPKLKIVKGTIGAGGKASNEDLAETIAWTDFLLQGSGPSLVAAIDLAAFSKYTGKPYGVFGITHGSFLSGNDQATLDGARFVFFRDSVSLELARQQGVKSPLLEFGPDGAFGCDLRNDTAAETFLKDNQLELGQFLCCIPRLRFTPYWTIRDTKKDETRHARNEEMKGADHAPLLESIIAVVRETKLKVLICPEDKTQMAIGKEQLYDMLPPDVKPRVVWRPNFWLPDEALSVYVRSAGLFGHEMHSPIMCIGNGNPAIVCRWAEQTSKGIMWRDIGLGEWLFDMDSEEDKKKVAGAVLTMSKNPDAAKEKAVKAREFVQHRQREAINVLRKELLEP